MKVNIGRYYKNGKDRKVSITVDDYDTWNLDVTLAEVILPALKKYLEVSDKIIDLDIPKFSGDLTERQALEECISAFDKIVTWDFEDEDDFEKVQRGLNLFAEIYLSLWS